MNVQEIKDWYKSECNKEIPSGWDVTEDMCLDYIVRDSYASGYNRSKEMQIKKLSYILESRLICCSNSEQENEEDAKWIEEIIKAMEE